MNRFANRLKCAVCVGLLLYGAVAGAATGPSASESTGPDGEKTAVEKRGTRAKKSLPQQEWMKRSPGNVEIPWMRVMYGTVTVLVLVCVGVYVLKRFGGASLGSGHYLDVLEVVPVDSNLRFIVVEIGNKVVLMASDGDGVTKVGEYPREDIPVAEEPGSEASAGFPSLLGEMLKGDG